MNTTIDRPSIAELDRLAAILAHEPLNRTELTAELGRIRQGLDEHGWALDRVGGLLDDSEKAARISLSREDDRLRLETSFLAGEVERLRRAAANGVEVADLRRDGAALIAGLRGHRDAEASLVLESADTEVGSGD